MLFAPTLRYRNRYERKNPPKAKPSGDFLATIVYMSRAWAFRRRVEYSIGTVVVLTVVSMGGYFLFSYQSPTCFDFKENGKEHGVDCGGACARRCYFDIRAPRVLWVDAFKITEGQYNAVAYVENANRDTGTNVLPYTLILSDNAGIITERSGTTVLPPGGTYPIFEGRIQTGTRVPTSATITFTQEDTVVWLPADVGRESFSLEKRDLTGTDSKPKLTTEIQNTLLSEAKDIEIIATLFDSKGKPLTASRTFVEYFAGRSKEQIIFTWPEPIASTLRSCEVPTDVVLAIDLSGSMDDDGGTPPEPITSVLKAGESFVNRLRPSDQIGVVTYATNASLVTPLSGDISATARKVSGLSIATPEQRGSTNPGDALKRMQEELLSSRHNQDARKIGILFTDGLANAPTKNPEGYATSTAVEMKKRGIDIYTIGLGSQVNQKFLREIATDAQNAFVAPSVKEVDDIYRSISTAICEDGPTVIEVIAKPRVNVE